MDDFPPPGSEQQRLSTFAGDWTSTVRFHYDPGSAPMVKPGSYRASVGLGGYFLHREFRVDLDDAGDFTGLAFHGYGLTGYDPFQRKYVGVWADSGSPALYLTEGTFDAAGTVFTETSRGPDPTGQPLNLRMVTTQHSADLLTFQIHRIGEDGDTLVTEMEHRR